MVPWCDKLHAYPQILDLAKESQFWTNTLAYLSGASVRKMVYCIDTLAQYYKMFYFRNLQMFAISYGVCPGQAITS